MGATGQKKIANKGTVYSRRHFTGTAEDQLFAADSL